jgi:hypothetical protein
MEGFWVGMAAAPSGHRNAMSAHLELTKFKPLK